MSRKIVSIAMVVAALSTAACTDITSPNDAPEPAANTQGGDV